jgi:flagellar protein FlaG
VAQVFNTSLTFSVDDATGKSVIEVIDKESEEVIRQIPPKQMLKLVGNMRNVMGMLLDIEI